MASRYKIITSHATNDCSQTILWILQPCQQIPPADVTAGTGKVEGHAAIMKHKEFKTLVKKEGSGRGKYRTGIS